MPNHVSNIVIADPEVIEGMLRTHSEEELAEHNREEKERRQRIIERDGNDKAFKPDVMDMEKPFVDFGVVIPEPERIFRGGCNGAHPHPHPDGGFYDACWYNFNNANWGTKWNAYSQVVDDRKDRVQFDTAWAHPYPVIEALSRKFPEHEIECKYADEDLGSNLGWYKMKNGEVILDLTPEGTYEDEARMEFACQIKYEKSYAEMQAEWNQDEIDSARRAMFCKRIEAERGGDVNGYKVVRDEGLEIPQDILDHIMTKEDAERYWAEVASGV